MSKFTIVLLVAVAFMLSSSAQLFAVDTDFEVIVIWADEEEMGDEDITLTLHTTNATGNITYDDIPMLFDHAEGPDSYWTASFEVSQEAFTWKVVLEAPAQITFDVYTLFDGNPIALLLLNEQTNQFWEQ